MKKIFIVLIVVSAIIILGVGGYYLRSRQQAPQPAAQETGTLPPVQTQTTQPAGVQTSGQATTGAQRPAAVAQEKALYYSVDKGNNTILVQEDGKILKASGGKSEILSGNAMAGFRKAYFSYDGKRVLALSFDGKANIFDVDQKKWTSVSGVFQDAAWSPSDRRVALLSVPSGGASSISTLNADDAKAKPVEVTKINQRDMTINWPYASKIFLGDEPSGNWASSLFSLDVGSKTFSLILENRLGLQTIWSFSSPAVGLSFFAGTTGRGGELRLIDQNGRQIQTFNFITFPSKCAFYNKAVTAKTPTTQSTSSATSTKTAAAPQQTAPTLVCAIPGDQSALQNNLLPDSYLKKSIFTSDNFVEIDISTGNLKALLGDAGQDMDADDLKVFNQSVFFINRYDQNVYSFQLPK